MDELGSKMLGISLPELSAIIIITIILIPAQELPKVIRFCTKTYQKIQKLYYKFLREINLLDI